MDQTKPAEITTDKDTGEEHVKLDATPEEFARAIFSTAPPPNPKLRKEEDKDGDWEEEC